MANALNLGDVVLPGNNYLSIFGFNIPVKSGLEGAFLFGDGGAQIGRNYAPGKANAVVVGSPQAMNGYTTFNETGYLESGISETAEMTIIIVCRDSTGNADPRPGFIGNHFDIASGGVAIFTASETVFRAQNIKNKLSDYCNLNATDTIATFTPMALRVRNNAPSVMRNMTTGANAASTSSAARTIDAARKIQIGRIPSDGFKGLNDMMAAIIYSRSITDEELSVLTDWLKGYCLSHGVSV
ncbi:MULTISPECIES: hypothetical protein [Pseudomonas putida group]|uniref:hypothetical protein n=1 Tax=Pseudomonas putida group TaxID=136845 RepID=UPI001E55568E|nr:MULTISPECIES: hypothetical protein [Pseudomonas putida group]MCE1053433.1 hypothetical protein [Pseudomonas alloputida]MCF1251932.1 hypothetical protein [Pseudomonas putida]